MAKYVKRGKHIKREIPERSRYPLGLAWHVFHLSVLFFFSLISWEYSIVKMYQNFFNQSPVDEHLGYFKFLTFLYLAAANI